MKSISIFCYSLVLVLWVTLSPLKAQENLIPNHSFEEYKKLPDKDGCFNDYIKDWSNLNGKKGFPNATPDYLHQRGSREGKTSTAYFSQVEPQHGEAMMGLIVMPKRPFYEYVCTQFKQALEQGSRYELSFFITNGNPKYCKCSGRGLGAYFSQALPQQKESERVEVEPQFMIEDNLHVKEWQKVSFEFTANEPYTHLTIGFFPKLEELKMKDITGGTDDCIYFFLDNFNLKKVPQRPEDEVVTILNLPQGIKKVSSNIWKIINPDEVPLQTTISVSAPAEQEPNFALSVKVQVKDKKSKQNLPAQISIIDLITKQEVAQAKTAQGNQTATFVLPNPNQRYGIFAKAQGYLEGSENLEPQILKQNLLLEKEIFLSPLQKGESIVLKNIYFETAKADLKAEAYTELQKLLELMKSNPNLIIEIAGHTDSEGDDNRNLELSQRRAEAVVQYLKTNNIDTKRLKSVGFGKNKPIATNQTPEGRQQNRRVELKILDN